MHWFPGGRATRRAPKNSVRLTATAIFAGGCADAIPAFRQARAIDLAINQNRCIRGHVLREVGGNRSTSEFPAAVSSEVAGLGRVAPAETARTAAAEASRGCFGRLSGACPPAGSINQRVTRTGRGPVAIGRRLAV